MKGRYIIFNFFLLVVPFSVFGFSIGDIEVESTINQKLNGEIVFYPGLNEKPSEVSIKKASSDTYKQQNITWQNVLDSVTFKRVGTSITFTSTSKVTNPFLDLLVEFNSGSEKKIRHYQIALSSQVSKNKIKTIVIKALKTDSISKKSVKNPSKRISMVENLNLELIAPAESLSASDNPNQKLKVSNEKSKINVKAGIDSSVSLTHDVSDDVLEKTLLVEQKVEDLAQLQSRIVKLERSVNELKNEANALSKQQVLSQGQKNSTPILSSTNLVGAIKEQEVLFQGQQNTAPILANTNPVEAIKKQQVLSQGQQNSTPILANTNPVEVIEEQDQVSSNRFESIKPTQPESHKEHQLPPPKKKSSIYMPVLSVITFIFIAILGWVVMKRKRIKGKFARTPHHTASYGGAYSVGKELIHSKDDIDINIIDLKLSSKEDFFIDDIDIHTSIKDKNNENIELKNEVMP